MSRFGRLTAPVSECHFTRTGTDYETHAAFPCAAPSGGGPSRSRSARLMTAVVELGSRRLRTMRRFLSFRLVALTCGCCVRSVTCVHNITGRSIMLMVVRDRSHQDSIALPPDASALIDEFLAFGRPTAWVITDNGVRRTCQLVFQGKPPFVLTLLPHFISAPLGASPSPAASRRRGRSTSSMGGRWRGLQSRGQSGRRCAVPLTPLPS